MTDKKIAGVNIRCSPDVRLKAEAVAQYNGLTMAGAVSMMINDFCRQHPEMLPEQENAA